MNAATGARLHLERISHRYGNTLAVDDVSMEIASGELVALLGPSGCGKTTLLRVIAGLMRAQEGHVVIGGDTVDALPPNQRGAGIVFQNYALFPHMNVAANVAYGLKARGADRAVVDETVRRMLALVRLEGFSARYPRELSGGQQQRVALARTLAVSPRVLLLDEPFGALDKNLRLDMQIEVKRLQRELGITTVMVTHDQEEALSMADRIAVMSNDRVEQFGTPDEIYDRPATRFVAGFVGTSNLLSGRMAMGEGGLATVDLDAGGRWSLPVAAPCSRAGAVAVSVRPEHLRFADAGEDGIAARLVMTLPLGPTVVNELMLADGSAVKMQGERAGAAGRPEVGAEVRLALKAGALPAVFAA
jgi:putative spermidine/putrescine transport system ATP-binding protein